MWIFLFIGVIVFPLLTPAKTGDRRETSKPNQLIETLSRGNCKFAIDLYKLMSQEANVLISPLSVSTSLAMMMSGVKRRSLSQIRIGLHLNEFRSREEADSAFSLVINSMSATNNYTISMTNRAFVDRDFEPKNSFKTALAYIYECSIRSMSFKRNPLGVATDINHWVKQQTDNRILIPFNQGQVPKEGVMILVNSLYFKGTWKSLFNPAHTTINDFYLLNGEKTQLPMLTGKHILKYSDYAPLDCKLLELEYLGNRYVMYIMLPFQRFGINSFKKQLTAKMFADMRRTMIQSEVIIKLPKINMQYQSDIGRFLKGMNVSDAFDSRVANLFGVTNERGVHLTQLYHQAFIAVDENGTVATSISAVSVEAPSDDLAKPISNDFVADHPFAYAIFDTYTEFIVFIGNLDDPRK